MKNKIQLSINTLLIILMPLMMYITVSDTKINFSIADIILVLIGVLFLINIKEFFVHKRWIYILYFVGLLISLSLSQFMGKFNDDFLHVSNNVMFMEMVKTVVVGMYFFSAFMFIRNEKTYRISLITISLSSIPVFIIGISAYIYFLLGKDFIIDAFEIYKLRFLGTFEDPNLCALYFIVIFFVSLLNFKTVKKKFLKYLMFCISIISLIVIILTMSRGGWLALAGASIVFVILNIRNFKKESILFVIPIIIVLLISLNMDYSLQNGKITNHIVDRIQDSLSKDNNEIDRVQLMKTAVKMGNDNFLFGVGKGSFPLNSYKYLGEDSPRYKQQNIPHNTILGFYAQQGIVGVLIFIILPSFILYLMIKSKRKQNIYLISLFIGLFIHSLTINVENVRFLWYIFGVMLAGERMNINLDFVPIAKINSRKYAVIVSVLSLLAVGLYLNLLH